jgi:hypothetical protein
VEIILNLAWALLTIFMVWAWIRTNGQTGHSRGGQIVAITLLVVILFPVISVTDDLAAAQNPAETDTCQRRDHLLSFNAHTPLPVVTLPAMPAFAGIVFGPSRYVSPKSIIPRSADRPALASIQNRPPPAA